MPKIREFRLRHAVASVAFSVAASIASYGAQAASSAPGAPTIGKATGGSAQASLLFTAPSSTGGAAISAYTASCVTGTTTTTTTTVYGSGSSSPLVVKELTNGSVYVCSVKAVNSVGSSRASAGVVVTPAAVPGAPTIRSATPASARASIAFLAPSSTGGMSITGYTASCVTGTATALTASGTSSPINVTGLANGSTYLCSVAAKNSMGTGASSGTVSAAPAAVTAQPGTPVVTGLTAETAQISVAFSAGSGGTASSYTATCSSASASKTATSTVSSARLIAVAGLTASTNYSCTVKAANTTGTSAVSNTMSTTTTGVSYSTPANFATVVATSYTPTTTLTATTTVTNRGYYMVSDAATASTTSNYASIGSTYSATTGYTLTSGTLSTASTYNDYLTKTLQLVAVVEGSNTYYRLDSYLHPNNSIDVASSTSTALQFKNNFGKTSVTGNGYITFSYDSTNKVLKAQNRYIYATTTSTSNGSTVYTGTYTLDSSFTGSGKYISYANSAYSLSATGTKLYLYTTPLSLGIPSFMNPNSIAFVTNGAAPFLTKVTTTAVEGTSGSIYSQVNSTYKSQVATVGTNTATKTAATTMLATIKAAVEANGEKLRYSTDVYAAYRDAALATKLVSDSIADGTPGQNLVPYVYFTNEYATSTTGAKTYHPFMVVVSYGNQASPNGLKDVPHPPGSAGASYPDATVTRYSNLENYTFSIPMKDYGLVTDVTTNVYPSSATRNLWYDTTSPWVAANVYTWADSADNGILIDGSVIFPTFNNALVPSHLAGELSASGCHVGQGGGGPHCHADGYQSGQGLGLYNDADYVGKTHPPLLGFGYDGIALFAIYRSSDSAMLGYSTALDGFGAHNHDSIGYHYHAHTVSNYTSVDQKGASTTKDMHVLMKGAYIGSTNSVPFFRTNSSVNDNKYLGGTVK